MFQVSVRRLGHAGGHQGAGPSSRKSQFGTTFPKGLEPALGKATAACEVVIDTASSADVTCAGRHCIRFWQKRFELRVGGSHEAEVAVG